MGRKRSNTRKGGMDIETDGQQGAMMAMDDGLMNGNSNSGNCHNGNTANHAPDFKPVKGVDPNGIPVFKRVGDFKKNKKGKVLKAKAKRRLLKKAEKAEARYDVRSTRDAKKSQLKEKKLKLKHSS
eukprot:Nk52_evm4s89 gene=Nk52_evmTU4s89